MDICADCINDLPWLGHSCQRCALPLGDPDARFCGACAMRPPEIDSCYAALAYEYPVNRLVTGLKYHRKLAYARVLGELLAIRMREALHTGVVRRPAMLVPVPMHARRLAGRTFNQADQLGRWLSKDTGISLNTGLLTRVRNTPPQTSLSRAERLQNLRGVFRLNQTVDRQCVALVDDVITTGSTVRELARVLKQHGAAEVQVWAVARADS
jgi:ComF family protein